MIPITDMNVYYLRASEKLHVGQLALKNRRFYFEYAPEFLSTGLLLSPFKLPLKKTLITNEDYVFQGLFGVFNDSLPDGWGRLLLDRKLRALSINPDQLSPLDRLCYVGSQGMGALVYEPEIPSTQPIAHENFDEIAHEISQFTEHDNDAFLDDLLAMNGSSAGARPKVLVKIDNEDWLIKFASSFDPKDIGAIEYAYSLMARAAGLNMPETRLFPAQHCSGYFAVERFDRINKMHLHMHTVSGLLHIDHREPSLDYETIMRVTSWLTKNVQECEVQFRAAVFNVLSHNRDDHAKNFSFLMQPQGQWQVSPSYDLTFSSGPSGEHCTMVMGEGKCPQRSHLLSLAKIANLPEVRAIEIINEVKQATSTWDVFAKEAGVSAASKKMIKTALTQLIHQC